MKTVPFVYTLLLSVHYLAITLSHFSLRETFHEKQDVYIKEQKMNKQYQRYVGNKTS